MIRSSEERAELHNGVRMPWLGLGTWKAAEGGEVEQAVRWALEIGYRHIDTASAYGNEAGVGRAIRDSGVPREEIFVTTKVWNSDQGYDKTRRAFDASLARLGMGYVDLYLIHWPVKSLFTDTWTALEAIYKSGHAKAIGVSNFLVHHLRDLLATARIVPMVNQFEFHPHLVQPELLRFCRENRIQPQAWSPLMKGDVGSVTKLAEIARKYDKSPAQLVLRWDLQHGVVTIPNQQTAHESPRTRRSSISRSPRKTWRPSTGSISTAAPGRTRTIFSFEGWP